MDARARGWSQVTTDRDGIAPCFPETFQAPDCLSPMPVPQHVWEKQSSDSPEHACRFWGNYRGNLVAIFFEQLTDTRRSDGNQFNVSEIVQCFNQQVCSLRTTSSHWHREIGGNEEDPWSRRYARSSDCRSHKPNPDLVARGSMRSRFQKL